MNAILSGNPVVDRLLAPFAPSPSTPPSTPAVSPVAIDHVPVESRIGRWLVAACAVALVSSATFVHMDAAATVSGTIGVAGNVQTVQHRDGGIIRSLHVREGQHVHAGDILIELAGGDVRASERAFAAQALGLQAERARLMAQQSGATTIAPPADFIGLTGEDAVLARDALALQEHQLADWYRQARARNGIVQQQQAQLSARIAGIGDQIKANDRQSKLIDDETDGLRQLAKRGFASINRVRAMERANAALVGESANLRASAAATREQIGEARMQALQVSSQQQVEASQRLATVEQSLGELMPKWAALRRQVEQQIAADTKLAKLGQHVRFSMTRDGLRIDLVDDADYSMFATGTTALVPEASTLIGLVADAIRATPNPIMIRGHTDALQFGSRQGMNNWTLSSGRAEATRRRLAMGGVPEGRFERIEGVADREPMIADNVTDPRNRRVAITLLYRRGKFGE